MIRTKFRPSRLYSLEHSGAPRGNMIIGVSSRWSAAGRALPAWARSRPERSAAQWVLAHNWRDRRLGIGKPPKVYSPLPAPGPSPLSQFLSRRSGPQPSGGVPVSWWNAPASMMAKTWQTARCTGNRALRRRQRRNERADDAFVSGAYGFRDGGYRVHRRGDYSRILRLRMIAIRWPDLADAPTETFDDDTAVSEDAKTDPMIVIGVDHG